MRAHTLTHTRTHTLSDAQRSQHIQSLCFLPHNVSYFSARLIWFENIFPRNCPLHDKRLYITTVHVHLYRT